MRPGKIVPACLTAAICMLAVLTAAHLSYVRDSGKYSGIREATDLYLEALPLEGNDAVSCLERAVALDPEFALAYAALSEKYAWGFRSDMNPADAYRKASEAASRALELDTSLAEAHAARAFLTLMYDWDMKAAEETFLRALNLDPSSAMTHRLYQHLLVIQGRLDEALVENELCRELEPENVRHCTAAMVIHTRRGDYDSCLEWYERGKELDHDDPELTLLLGFMYIDRKDYAAAEKLFGDAGLDFYRALTEGHRHRLDGDRKTAGTVFHSLTKELDIARDEDMVKLLMISAAGGRRERTLGAVKELCKRKSPVLMHFACCNPYYRVIMRYARCRAILLAYGFSAE